MKLESSHIDKHGTGWIRLSPESREDIWILYQLLLPGDQLTSWTHRKVQKSTSELGSSVQARVRLRTTVEIHSVECDLEGAMIRVHGSNVVESEYLKMGQFHTVEVECNKSLTLCKQEWDSVCWEMVKNACEPMRTADSVVVVMQAGLCNVCLISNSMTLVRAKIEMAIPKKRVGSSQHDKAVTRFYEQILEAILKHVDWEVVKVVVLASPAFFKDELFEYINAQAIKRDLRSLIENRARFVLVHCASGHKHSVKEILGDPIVASKIQNTHAMDEIKDLDRFFKMLDTDPDRALYGLNHSRIANESNAIETLLITDELFRSSDVATRKIYVTLVESVKQNDGCVRIFSTLHVSGEQLRQMTGIAAILRFPMPEIDAIENRSQHSGSFVEEKS